MQNFRSSRRCKSSWLKRDRKMEPEESRLTLTNSDAITQTKSDHGMKLSGSLTDSRLARLGHILAGTMALSAAIATSANTNLVQLLENQGQSWFFEWRGPVAPPEDIVILAIDNDSLKQIDIYHADPKQYSYLEPIKSWPFKRIAYAQAINKIMAAGAKSVALNLVLDRPSQHGAADDAQLQQVLRRYPGKVTLGAIYEDVQTHQGTVNQLIQPNQLFWTQPMSVGSVNYLLEPGNKIYKFGWVYRKTLDQSQDKSVAGQFKSLTVDTPSFSEAVLTAAQIKYPKPQGDRMYFHGPSGTFTQVPFWYVLDPVNWAGYLQNGNYFKDKIVLIGPTATRLKDFHPAPFSQSSLYPEPLSGIEIHANAIASLQQGKAIRAMIPNAPLRGVFVFAGTVGAGIWLSRRSRSLSRFGWTMGIIAGWGVTSYLSFTYGQISFPTIVPMGAIALSGISYLTTNAIREQRLKRRLREILATDPTSPIVREIINTQPEFEDLLTTQPVSSPPPTIKTPTVPVPSPKQATTPEKNQLIGGRYEIIKVLGAGGFGETYVACDTQRPGNPQCVVKQLKPAIKEPKHLKLARRLFQQEAEVLEKLGKHPQIPTLLAYFEENEEFYLVQEMIDGHALDEELLLGRKVLELSTIDILQEILAILEFVHSQAVIHRDIKPANIIRRHADNKLVLIDFGAVREINTQLMENDGKSRFTIGIGTQGYAPNEQCSGRPRFNSDVYAVGMMGIQALTGLPPSHLELDGQTGELVWISKATVSDELAAIISKMVCYDFRERYQSATEARMALLNLSQSNCEQVYAIGRTPHAAVEDNDLEDPTEAWSEDSTQAWSEDGTAAWSGALQSEENASDDATAAWLNIETDSN